MKKRFFLFSTLIFLASLAYTAPAERVNEYKLENGMTVFLLEDTSTPLIRLEYTVRAGFSSQTQKTSGFFKLYSRIFQAALPQISFDDIQCNSDSTRYITTIPTSKLEAALECISEAAFNPQFSNDTIKTNLSALKKEVKENYASMSGFINASIDSRVFSAAPWKHDSGVYPSVFNATTDKNARIILSSISERWYTPQNSALFISGNINLEQVKALVEEYFSRFYSTFRTPVAKTAEPVITHKKYVLHNPEFSPEMTQVVLQYLNLNTNECDIAGFLYNNNLSYFKYLLLNEEELNIPGDEYIDAASAHKKDSNRLIIQTLLQPPENKKIKTNSFLQVQTLLKLVKTGVGNIQLGEFFTAKQAAVSNMNLYNNSSAAFMDSLSNYWAMEPYDSYLTDYIENPEKSITTENFLSKIPKYDEVSPSSLSYKLETEEPFVFVIINSADYKKYKKEYTDAGFEEITVDNASWKNQKIFASIKDYEEAADKLQAPEQTVFSPDNNYYATNKAALKEVDLKNGIPLITKFNPNSDDVTILLSIRGGKLHTSNDHGFEEVMINILTNNIQREIYTGQQKGLIEGSPYVTWQTELTTSHVVIECSSKDFENIATCISNAIIYSDVLPAAADRAVSSRQYKKRLENGSAVNQMYSAAIRQLYPKTDFPAIYETEKDILETTNYQKILEYYPVLLDSSRYTIIVTGNYPANVQQIMNKTMGQLANQKGKINISTGENKLTEYKTLNIKINHTFLTDIPAEKAGPMPAVLIPTTEFLDPVMYIFNSPKKGTKTEAIYNALLLYVGQQLQFEINKNSRLTGSSVNINPAKPQMDTAGIIVNNVPHTKELDSVFRSVITSIKKNLASSKALTTIQDIKDLWIQTELSKSYTNTGTAELLQRGLEYFPYLIKPEYYLEEYNFIQQMELSDLMEALEYIPEQAYLRIYSKEGKK